MLRGTPKVHLLPTLTELVPWTDRRGRFNPMRAITLTLVLLPGLYLLGRWPLGLLGPEPLTTAIHATGYWGIWLLVASLVITPLKALGASPNIVVLRRMIGNAALVYVLAHLVLYSADQQWKLMTVVSEILRRFYLTIGFVAVLGLLVLGATSTDGWVRHLGSRWKRLHRLVYGLVALGLFHYVLQSKLDISHALLATGVFAWLMLWRALPAGRDRSWPWLLLVTGAAALMTLAAEYAWYRFGTRINPQKVMLDELDVAYALHPAGQALLLGLVATLLVALRRATDTRLGATPFITAAVYALGGAMAEAAPWLFGLQQGDVALDDPWPWARALVWVALMAVLGRVRWGLAEAWQKHLVDGLWVGCLLYQLGGLLTDDPRTVVYGAALLLGGALLLAARLWSSHRGAVLLLLPLAGVLVYQAAA